MTPECLAIIPARGGSKGVPRKNIRMLAGKPLIAHTIEQALATRRITRLVVSTDDAEIAGISARYGAEVVMRPAEISGDTASSESALLHALDVLRDEQQYEPGITVLLQCTSPLTAAEDMDGTIDVLLTEEADCSFAATPFFHFLWKKGPEGAVGINHDNERSPRKRRQDLAPQFLETGAVYAMRTASFRERGSRFCGRIAFHVMPGDRCLEIDEPADFPKAEALIRHEADRRQAACLPPRVGAIVFDFDGVFTDDRVIVFEDGREAVMCHRGDGLGLEKLKRHGVPMLVLSKERNPVVSARCRKLGIECLQGVDDKLPSLKSWVAERGVALSDVIYLGNDVNDLECLGVVGCGVVPADGHARAKAAANLVLRQSGGQRAIRELTDMLLDPVAQSESRLSAPIQPEPLIVE